jgi:hypothetical protein
MRICIPIEVTIKRFLLGVVTFLLEMLIHNGEVPSTK